MSCPEKSHRRRHSNSSSDSDHHKNKKKIEVDTDSSVEIELYSNKHKKTAIHIDRRCRSRSSSPSPRSPRSCSPSSSSSSCEKKHKHKKHSHKSCSSDSEHKDKHKKHSRKSYSSDSENKDKCSFDEIYKYYKYRMVTDKELMVAGSTAYLNMNNNVNTTIAKNYEAKLDHVTLKQNIDLGYINVPYYVREEGVYILFFVIDSNQASQFAYFVNGEEKPLTRYGNNSGAGQLVLRSMLKLKENDAVVIRNSRSSSATITTDLYVGGLLTGNNLTYTMMKIAPCEIPKCIEWDNKCMSKKKLYLFNKLLEKMMLDKELMMKGFNIHGSFYRKTTATIPTESDIPFEFTSNLNGLSWDSLTPENVSILEDGVYKIFFLTSTTTSAQMTFFVNGVSIDTTTVGVNKGAAQISLRALYEFKKGDILTIRNHTSGNGSIIISEDAGGKKSDVCALLTVFKIAPLDKPSLDECKLNNYHKKTYCKFKQFLLNQKCLQVAGSNAYFDVTGDTKQILNVGDAVDWSNTALLENVWHNQGSTKFTIQEDGIYDIFGDLTSNQPAQWTLFVNDVPEPTTTFGRDSGGGRTLIRQFIKLLKGDVINIRNYEAYSAVIETSTNAGGELVGQSVVFMAFKLSPLDDCKPKCDKPKCDKPKCDKPKCDKK